MADENESRYFSSTIDAAFGSSAQQTTLKDNRSLFIKAMADPTRRRIAFDVVERNCRMRFRVGEEGIRAFLEILQLVQSSNLDEAVDEFKKRFLPMLDQKLLKRRIEEPHRESDPLPSSTLALGSPSPNEALT
jgi:hypothetical protein